MEKSDLHFMLVPPNHEGETAVDNRIVRTVVGILQRARSQEGVVCWVERDRPELLPVPDHRFFRQDFVECNLALYTNQVSDGRKESPHSHLGTHISQPLHRNVDQFGHLLVAPEDLASPPPAAGWDGHACEDTVVLHQRFLEPHLDVD